MSGDPYIKENEELRAEVAKLRGLLEWLHSRGGLGLDVHERIDRVLAKEGE